MQHWTEYEPLSTQFPRTFASSLNPEMAKSSPIIFFTSRQLASFNNKRPGVADKLNRKAALVLKTAFDSNNITIFEDQAEAAFESLVRD